MTKLCFKWCFRRAAGNFAPAGASGCSQIGDLLPSFCLLAKGSHFCSLRYRKPQKLAERSIREGSKKIFYFGIILILMSLKTVKMIKDNFHGALFQSENPGTAMIVVTGSDGGIKWAKGISKIFCDNGISCLAVAYWKEKNLPKSLSLIPIEIIAEAADCLKNKGYAKIGIYGFSKGAELALLAASHFFANQFCDCRFACLLRF